MAGRFKDFLRDMTIRWKLTAIITAVSGLTLFLGVGSVALLEWFTHHNEMVKQVSVLAEITGSNSAAPLVFDDRDAARETLASLTAARDIVGAALYRKDGSMFAVFFRSDGEKEIFPAGPLEEGHYFEGGRLIASRHIVLDGERIGSVTILSSMQSMYDELKTHVVISVLVLSLVLFLAFLLSTMLQKVVSEPLGRLTRLMLRVSRTRDYSLRSEEHGRDETGLLAEGFNGMLSEIQERTAELAESEEKYSKLFHYSNDPIIIHDLAGDILDVNQRATDVFRYSRAEILPRSILEFHPEGSLEKSKMALEKSVQDGFVNFETDFRRKDGEVFPAEVSSRLFEIGGVKVVQSIVRDITERRRAEELLTLMKEAIETTRLGITITDRGGKIIFTNQAEAEMHGYEVEELIGRESRLFAPPDVWSPFTSEQVDGMGHYSRESVNVRKDGTVFPVSITSVPVRDAGGRPVALISVCKDITEQKEAEDELRRSEERYRALYQQFNAVLDAIPDVLMLISPDMKVLWLNRASEDLCKTEDIAEHPCYRACHERTLPCEGCPALRSFRTGNEEGGQVSAPGGRTLDVRAIPIKDAEGRVINVLEVISDITERVLLQEKAIRTKHLASLGELAAGVAHEINNPMNSIINYAQILIDENAKRKPGSTVGERIIKEGNRVAGIVRSLLSFARETEEKKSPCSVYDIVEDTLALTKTQLRKEGVALSVVLPKDLHDITANARHIQQVLLNLISNARYSLNEKYPGKDENKSLRITGENMEVGGVPHIQLRVRDTGTGIPDDIINIIVNPFFTTKPSGKGTGLGLSICHGIINDHGGRILFNSVEGEYTEVAIDLPEAGGNER
jgi:PAS domain S-box-containing protein